MNNIRIAIGSDIHPTYADYKLFEDSNVLTLLGDLLPEWQNADFSFANVESPLTSSCKPIIKTGPNIKASPISINFYKKLGITAVGLANNHIRDFGQEGVLDTLENFIKANILVVGAGRDLVEARQPLIYQFANGKKLGIMAMAEREFCIAEDNIPGANPIDHINYTKLAQLRKEVNKVILVLHGGTELYQYPRPGLVDLCHFLADQGADAIVVQHTHCVGCFEEYNGVPILYGQGNFIFRNINSKHPMTQIWREGLHVNLIWEVKENILKMEFIPFEQNKDYPGIRRIQGNSLANFEKEFMKRSEILKDRKKLVSIWSEFCKGNRSSAILNLLGVTGILGKIFRFLPIMSLWLRFSNILLSRNMISCESHQELIVKILDQEYKKI